MRDEIKQPAVIGWAANQRQVDLVIERSFKIQELLGGIQGWATVDGCPAFDVIQQPAKRKVQDDFD